MSFYQSKVDGKLATFDGMEMCSAFQLLEGAGADVLGLNCARGPATTLPLLEELKKVLKVHMNNLLFVLHWRFYKAVASDLHVGIFSFLSFLFFVLWNDVQFQTKLLDQLEYCCVCAVY